MKRRKKLIKNLQSRQKDFDAIKDKQGYKRPGSMSGRK